MAVHFDRARLEQVIDNHALWWEGKLDRPLVRAVITDAYEAKQMDIPVLSQANCTDFRYSPEELIEALDNWLSRQEYLGDGYPLVNFDGFGPGVLAAFCGAKLDNSSGGVWFFPPEEDMELRDIHVRYDPENVYVRRIKDIYRAGLKKWNGSVVMGLPDLGGVMDVAATFRGSENLLLDLYDEPDEVLRLVKEIETAWYEAFYDFVEVLRPQGCFTDWNGLLSREPSYIIQCDFCYMIGNPMFRGFVLETLRRDTEKLCNTIYHLDGVGELNHLDDILTLEKLNAVQWVFGAGKPDAENWLDIYRKIAASGKQYMVTGSPESFLKVMSELHGTPFGSFGFKQKDRDLAMQVLSAR